MENLIYALNENVGNPGLFTGREELMDNFTHWIYHIGKRIGKSRALLSRRKKGKTVFMQRLYNIVWTQNGKVIPFFYEFQEKNIMFGDFAEDFLRSFLSQYHAFLNRSIDLVKTKFELSELQEIFSNDKFISDRLHTFFISKNNNNFNNMWETARCFPHNLASVRNIQFLQFIDEFQYINKYVIDNNYKSIETLAGSYLATAESRCAPMFISGSYIGWLRKIIWKLLPARFNEFFLENLTPAEGFDMILKHAKYYEIPVTEKSAQHILDLSQGDPYYIVVIFEGTYLGKKDFTDVNSINDVYEHEITKGNVRGTWLEYLYKAFSEVNDKNAKKIVLYLFNANGKERNREEIIKDLNLEMTEHELETRLKALVYADIISQGESDFRYKVSTDKIYELVFRNIYQEEIDRIGKGIKKALQSKTGKISHDIGHYYEYLFETIFNKGFNLKDVTYNGNDKLIKSKNEIYRNYFMKATRLRNIEIDIYGENETSEEIIIEMKSGKRKTGIKNIEKYIKFKKKLEEENRNFIMIFFAVHGFTKEAEIALSENGIFYGDKVKYPVV